MIANFFGKSSPINFVIILGLFLVYFFTDYFLLHRNFPIDEVLILTPLFFVLFFFYNFILYKNKLTLYNSYAFLFFVILFASFSMTYFDRNTLLFHCLLLIFYRKVFSLRNSVKTLAKLFDAGLWLGVLFIFNPFFGVFGVLIYLSNSLFQKTSWQTLLIPVIGFMTPLLCSFTYHFWFDQLDVFWNYFNWYTSYDYGAYDTFAIKVPGLTILTITLIALVLKTPKVLGISGAYRKYWSLITLMLLLSVGLILLFQQRNGSELQYLFFPISIILTNGLESMKSRFVKELVLILAISFPFVLLII